MRSHITRTQTLGEQRQATPVGACATERKPQIYTIHVLYCTHTHTHSTRNICPRVAVRRRHTAVPGFLPLCGPLGTSQRPAAMFYFHSNYLLFCVERPRVEFTPSHTTHTHTQTSGGCTYSVDIRTVFQHDFYRFCVASYLKVYIKSQTKLYEIRSESKLLLESGCITPTTSIHGMLSMPLRHVVKYYSCRQHFL